jgi:hypothetical protein
MFHSVFHFFGADISGGKQVFDKNIKQLTSLLCGQPLKQQAKGLINPVPFLRIKNTLQYNMKNFQGDCRLDLPLINFRDFMQQMLEFRNIPFIMIAWRIELVGKFQAVSPSLFSIEE